MKKLSCAILLIVLTFWSLPTPVNAKMLEIKGKYPASTHPKPGLTDEVSSRNILGLDHSGKYGMPLQALSPADPVMLKVLAIRVNFKREVTDDPQTTGNGTFDMRTKAQFQTDEGHLIDPAPHDRTYFEKHMEALAAYYRVVSNGRLEVIFDVYPRDVDSAYQLDSSMSYYGLQSPEYGLGEFVSDALHKADGDSTLTLYNGGDVYDAYMIFHAGSDQQNNMTGFGVDTPGDLYTGYVKLGAPFLLENGRVLISDAVVMPESPSQDGRVTALNAVMGHEFGHQLGLVDLYDTRTGMTQVGDFSLMDYNGFGVNIDLGETVPVLVQGVMPIFPDAWSRAYLGFVDVVEVTSANNIKVLAAELDTNFNQVLMVPINADEYFLVENRRTDIDGYGVTNLKADSTTDVILGPRSPGNPANNREYDFLIPGSGMVIWHIDELVARLDYNGDGINNFNQNQLQLWNFASDARKWDNHHRFVSLVEADGIIDFGGYYYSGYGKQADFFEINGNATFGPNTNPPTIANNNAYTGITIGDISVALLIMTCDVKIEGHLAGWPNQVFVNSLPLVPADLNGDDQDEILTAAGFFLLAYKPDGSSLFRPTPGNEIAVARDVFHGSGIVLDTLAVMGQINRTLHFEKSLAVGDINGDSFAEVVGVTSGNTVVCFTTATLSYDGEAIKLFEKPLDGPAATAPMILDYDQTLPGLEILVYNELGEKLVFDKSGNRLSKETEKWPFRVMSDSLHNFELISPAEGVMLTDSALVIKGAAAADFDRDGQIETAEVYADGRLKINYTDNPVTINVGGAIGSEISLGDINDDGYLKILFCGDNLIYAYNRNGTPVSNFPIVVNRMIPTGIIKSSPALADIDGDDKMEIFVGTPTGELAGFNLNGDRLENFPKSTGGSISAPVVFARGGATAAIFALTDEGGITAFAMPTPSKIAWNTIYGSPRNFGSYERPLPTPTPIAEAIGYVYNYPNPASGRTTIRFAVRESGEVTMKFFNVAGDLVFDTRVTAIAGTDNELPFDCSRLASGVYFCQLETLSGDRKHCTVAIVK
ncbi:MAG: T9SS type A sorting domain-containing protein [Candidatus Zixiibacteriota bacterium]|nr:MAG: T9SS type A sorting domain-containing protein [candidate division Zixibacteria bacterium]